jgi:predicted nucleic acid-binding Zn ribbon protein
MIDPRSTSRRDAADPSPIGEQLRAFMRSSPVVKQSRAHQAMTDVWTSVAGADVAAHTAVRGLRLGVLTIAVDSPPLCHELGAFRRTELLEAMNRRLGTKRLKDLHFRHGPG